MPQVFSPAFNTIVRASIAALVLFPLVGGVVLAYASTYSDWHTRRDEVRHQPIPFSHEHHVRGLGIDCRYCHTSVTESSFAGIPPTKTCMSCHSQIWWTSPTLEPVRSSWANNTPIQWTRVHDLPDYVYFNHAIHVNKGVGCTTCHGAIAGMPLTLQVVDLQMKWCISCHREPEKNLRPLSEVFNPDYHPPENQLELGAQLVAQYHVHKEQLTNCSICHR